MSPSTPDFLRSFARIGLLSFGGPAAQISIMHEELVTRRNWLSEDQFLGALSFCMLLPGPEAMQLAAYSGWRLRGTLGGLIAGLFFVLPGALVIAALAALYLAYGDLPLVIAAFAGVKAAVVIIVFQALAKVAGKALHGPLGWALALAGFGAIYVLGLPFPLIIASAALIGLLATTNPATSPVPAIETTPAQTLRTALIWGALWAAPIGFAIALDATFLTDVALYFSRLAVLTFGGAYAVLAWMAQTVVETYGWITTGEVIDALGLAETTPGPLILVTEFVALLAGYHHGGWTMAALAGLMALWVTFIPCFLWIFTGAPYVEYLLAQPRLTGALKAITAAVVGVIANLTLWFAMNVLFGTLTETAFGHWPDLTSLDLTAAALTTLAALLGLGLRLGMIPLLALMALAGMLFASFSSGLTLLS
ncbi:chromate efflux transporter [Rhodobacteraceae bacterium D3-12]|nr:chromate efflux transporter [Rhodobacteraceae bacterium D3-12]